MAVALGHSMLCCAVLCCAVLCFAVLQHARQFSLLMFLAYCCLSQVAQRQPCLYGMHESRPIVGLIYMVLVQQLTLGIDI